MTKILNAAVEGFPDEAAVSALCEHLDIESPTIFTKHGKGNLDKYLAGYNAAAKFSPWLVLRDLDRDATCAAQLKNDLMPKPCQQMIFRVVVRAIESWFLADSQQFASFFQISPTGIPTQPELLPNPKQFVVELIRNSRNRDIREDMIPREKSGATEGPAYASRLMEFALFYWRPQIAAQRSDSLRRCIKRLREL